MPVQSNRNNLEDSLLPPVPNKGGQLAQTAWTKRTNTKTTPGTRNHHQTRSPGAAGLYIPVPSRTNTEHVTQIIHFQLDWKESNKPHLALLNWPCSVFPHRSSVLLGPSSSGYRPTAVTGPGAAAGAGTAASPCSSSPGGAEPQQRGRWGAPRSPWRPSGRPEAPADKRSSLPE